MARFLSWLRNLLSPMQSGVHRTDLQAIANQTERAIRLILLIVLAVIVAILISGWVNGGGVRFVIWAFVGALSAIVVGGAVGLLFGLPTAERRSSQVAVC